MRINNIVNKYVIKCMPLSSFIPILLLSGHILFIFVDFFEARLAFSTQSWFFFYVVTNDHNTSDNDNIDVIIICFSAKQEDDDLRELEAWAN